MSNWGILIGGEKYRMKAMVIFESVYGNTEKVAQSIGAALAAVG
jgi:flavorubredoxin